MLEIHGNKPARGAGKYRHTRSHTQHTYTQTHTQTRQGQTHFWAKYERTETVFQGQSNGLEEKRELPAGIVLEVLLFDENVVRALHAQGRCTASRSSAPRRTSPLRVGRAPAPASAIPDLRRPTQVSFPGDAGLPARLFFYVL